MKINCSGIGKHDPVHPRKRNIEQLAVLPLRIMSQVTNPANTLDVFCHSNVSDVFNKGFIPLGRPSLYPDCLIPVKNCLLVDAP